MRNKSLQLGIALALILVVKPAFAQFNTNIALNATVTCETSAGSNSPCSALKDNNRETWWQGTKIPEKVVFSWGSVSYFNGLIFKQPLNSVSANYNVTIGVETSMDGVNWTTVQNPITISFIKVGAPMTSLVRNGNWAYLDLGYRNGSLLQGKFVRITFYRNLMTYPSVTDQSSASMGEIEIYYFNNSPTAYPAAR